MSTDARWGDRLLRVAAAVRARGYALDRRRRRWGVALFDRALKGRYGRHVALLNLERFAAEEAPRWGEHGEAPLRLSIVVVTYRQPVQLECLLASLLCQTLQNFEVLVYHDGPDAATREVAERFMRMSDRVRYVETGTRYNDWGHTLRDMGLRAARGEYLLITNGDNYYVPRFCEFVTEAVDAHRLDMVLWDLVHSYSSPGQKTLRCYTPFAVYPARYMVDIAAVMVRTDLARQAGFAARDHSADATYVESVLRLPVPSLRIGKVQKTLAVHN